MKKRLLLHVCCAPCLIVPANYLQDQYSMTAFWFNPNVQPMTEYFKRVDAVRDYTQRIEMKCVYCHDYDPIAFFRQSAFNEDKRCTMCYEQRLRKTYLYACQNGFDGFSTTLIQSHQQDITIIKSIVTELSSEGSVPFIDFDFHDRWKEGVNVSRQIGLYRQQYCGCVYSEYDRYRHQYRKDYQKDNENGLV